jgi:hypothetical protein
MARLFGQVLPLFDESTTPVFGAGAGVVVVSVDVRWPAGGVEVVAFPASVLGWFVVLVVVRHRQPRRLSSLSVENTPSSAAGLPTDPASSAEPHPTPTSAAQSSEPANTVPTDCFRNPRNTTTSLPLTPVSIPSYGQDTCHHGAPEAALHSISLW